VVVEVLAEVEGEEVVVEVGDFLEEVDELGEVAGHSEFTCVVFELGVDVLAEDVEESADAVGEGLGEQDHQVAV